MFHWKKFQFFDKELVKEDGSDRSHSLLQRMRVKAATTGQGHVILGDSDGSVHIFDNQFTTTSFNAFKMRCDILQHLRHAGALLGVGSDDGKQLVLRIWDLEAHSASIDRDGPQVVSSIPLPETEPLTAMCASEDLNFVALGTSRGTVVMLRGEIARQRFQRHTVALAGSAPVTGLHLRYFRGDGDQSSSAGAPGVLGDGALERSPISLYAVTSEAVHCFHLRAKSEAREVVLEQGCEAGCSAQNAADDLIVARTEAVYFVEREGKGPCFALEGEKKLIAWHRSYLLVVSIDKNNSTQNMLHVYDLSNKFIAFSGPFTNIEHVVCEWGSVFVLTSDGTSTQMYQLTEKDTQTKMNILFKRNLYSIAINLAHAQNLDQAHVVDIYRKYGDHLYSKGDYDGAIGQYLRTIGRLEPSYVIRLFLDAQRIHNLTTYLEALHEKNVATADHTTLLLNCYTKLKDVKRLDDFVEHDSGLHFDVETAIKVCRQAGYHTHAVKLAEKHAATDFYLKIQVEDLGNYKDALAYVQTLSFEQAEASMVKYGKALVTNLPEETTAALMRLCSNYTPQAKQSGVSAVGNASQSSGTPEQQQGRASNPENFIRVFTDQPKWLRVFLEFIIQQNASASKEVFHTLFELYLVADAELAALTLEEKPAETTIQIARQREELGNKALELLQNRNAQYDANHALVLAQAHNFDQGTLFLYEKLKLYREIVQYHMDTANYAGVIRACKKYGGRDPSLWIHVLSYFVSKGEESCRSEIVEVLSSIDRNSILPPLIVVQILSQSQKTSLGLVKDFLSRRLREQKRAMDEDTRLAQQYRDETKRLRREVYDMSTQARVFQAKKCTACGETLDHPSVHFFSYHSYHQRCLGDNEDENPALQEQIQKVADIKSRLESTAHEHDQFFRQLEGSPDGFSVVAEYLGRGIFDNARSAAPGGVDEATQLLRQLGTN